jgi:outer membrane cobalamin receptor
MHASRFLLDIRGSLASLVVVAWSVASPGHALPIAPGSDPSPARVVGTVVDPDGALVPGARLLLVLTGGGAVVAEASTDGRGEFRFDRVAPGRYELRAMADGFRAEPVAVQAAAGEDSRVRLLLHVSAVSESVVVSAAQVELPLARAADSVTVLPASDLRALQVETVADAMRSVPGITVSRNGGRGSVTSMFPRGGESNYTAVFVDGVKANAFGGGYDFSALAAADVERVEVVRGPESALFGADAIGGVVQVVTKRGGRPRAELLAEGGSFGTSHVSAGTWGSRGAWSWGASGEQLASDGFTGIAPATGTPVSNDDSLAKHGSFAGGWHAAGGADLRATVNLTSTDRGVPGPYGSNPLGTYSAVDTVSRNRTATQQYGVRWTQPFGNGSRHVRQSVTANYLDQAYEFTFPDYFTGLPTLSASGTTRFDLRAQTDLDLAASAAVSFGAEFLSEQATADYIITAPQTPVPIDRHIVAGFGEVRYQPASGLSLTGGVRVERIVRDALGQSPDPYSPRPGFGTDAQTSANPRVSVAYFFAGQGGGWRGWTRLHAAAGTGIRPPDAIEIAFTDNPALEPERSRSVEAGLDQAILGERLLVGATAFYNRYSNLIETVGRALHDASRYRTDNIANARSAGVEVWSRARAWRSLDVRVAYTFLPTAVLSVDGLDSAAPPPFEVGDPLLRRPRHSGSVELVYTRGAATAFGRVGARARALDGEPNYGPTAGLFYNPGFTVVDAGASWRIVPAFEVIGRVGNLFDRSYEEALGYPALGRNVMIGVRVAAGR